jgi:hypothetical protein
LSHALIIEDESCNIFKVGHAKLFPTSTKEYRKGIHGIDLYGLTAGADECWLWGAAAPTHFLNLFVLSSLNSDLPPLKFSN